MSDASTKHIILDIREESTSSHPNPKIPRKKVGSQKDDWITTAANYSTQESQLELIQTMDSANCQDDAAQTILLTHLKAKQSGYRSQDTAKEFYDHARFIQIPDLIHLLSESNLSCFYCRKWATLFYENVRDPRQWSLERLSNAEGHNRDNVVIACLECNMRRRTMYYERYLVTKQLKVNKIGSDDVENNLEDTL
jgi:RNase P subunit RPR2